MEQEDGLKFIKLTLFGNQIKILTEETEYINEDSLISNLCLWLTVGTHCITKKIKEEKQILKKLNQLNFE